MLLCFDNNCSANDYSHYVALLLLVGKMGEVSTLTSKCHDFHFGQLCTTRQVCTTQVETIVSGANKLTCFTRH